MKIAIIGAGFSGLAAAVRLSQAGFHDLVLLERANEVGGVWRDNTYPGCACDVQSHLYSLSFAPNPTWSRAYSPQPEILAYLKRVAVEHGVRDRIRFEHEVVGAHFDSASNRWCITAKTPAGDVVIEADAIVGAQGALSEPKTPSLPGLEQFAGKVMHSAKWDASYDLRGKRVAVVGTGASAIQIVPAIQPVVDRLVLFQRTPPWVLPRRDHPISERAQRLFSRLPTVQSAFRSFLKGTREIFLAGFLDPRAEKIVRRLAHKHLARQVPDPVLRAKLTPDYAVGCKRILLSDDYLPALTQANVDVVTDGIGEVRAHSIVDVAGEEHAVDVIVLATGFHVTDPPFAKHVRGRDGRSLSETWSGSPRAHVGTTVHGFPSFFLLQGPNTGLGHSSVLEMIEVQIAHVVEAIKHAASSHAAIEPSADAQAKWIADVDQKMRTTVWQSGGCASWYIDATGRNSTLWPGSIGAYKRRARFTARDYVTIRPVAALPANGDGDARVRLGGADVVATLRDHIARGTRGARA